MNDVQTTVVFENYPKVPVQAFVSELAFEFSELPEDAIPHYLLRTINRMCRRGNILRRTAFIHTQDCVTNYLLEPPDCMDIVAVMNICNVCGNTCGAVQRLTNEPCRMTCGTVSWFETPNVIHFNPPHTGSIYRVEMSVAPTFDTCEVDAKLLNEHYDIVLDGAKSFIYGMADKSWSSVARAQEHRAAFERAISGAAVDTMLKGQRGAIKMKRPRAV